MAEGLNVYFVELQDGDASELGFQEITQRIADTDIMTFESVMQKKMNLLWT